MKLSGAPCSCGARGVDPKNKYRAVQFGVRYNLRLFNCVRCHTTRVRVIESSRRPPPEPPPPPAPAYESPDHSISPELLAEILADFAKNATGEEAA